MNGKNQHSDADTRLATVYAAPNMKGTTNSFL